MERINIPITNKKCGINREEYKSTGHHLHQSDVTMLDDKCFLQHLIKVLLNRIRPIKDHLKVHAYYLTPPKHMVKLVNILNDCIIPDRMNVVLYWEQRLERI